MYQQVFNQQHPQQIPQQHHRPQQPYPSNARPPIENTTPPTALLTQGNAPPFLPGSASLIEQLDRRLLLILRDGRHIIGILRSFDHFCNLILEECVERRMKRSGTTSTTKKCPNNNTMVYTDVPLGLFITRGDALVLLGETNEEDSSSSVMQRVTLEEFEEYPGHEESHWVVDFDNDLVV